MPAVTEASVYHGASPGTPADITNTTIRFKQADNDTQDAADSVPVPAAGFNYSWRKNFKLRAPATGPDNQIDNLRFFSEGQSLGTDKVILATQAAAYTQGAVGDESAEVVGDIATVDVDTYTAGVPLVVKAGIVFTALETGDGAQDFVVLQARLGPLAKAGDADAAKGLLFRFDES